MTKRIEYVDAMRGFLMLLVVMNHIEVFSFGNRVPSYGWFFLTFLMPLFFFTSGWLFYKDHVVWNLKNAGPFLKKKFKVLIIPTLFFLYIFLILYPSYANRWWFDSAKKGYWFTYVLFEYFIIYAIISVILPRKWEKERLIILLVLSFVIYGLSTNWAEQLFSSHANFYGILSVPHWCFFPFFIMGMLCKKHFCVFCSLMDQRVFSTFIILIPIFLILNPSLAQYKTFYFFSSGICGVAIIFTFFRKNESIFTKEHRLGVTLQYIGKRTLGLYLIHYLFIPRNLNMVGDFFKQNDNRTLELFVAMTVAMMVVVVTLLVERIIRLSPFLERYLFGVTQNK